MKRKGADRGLKGADANRPCRALNVAEVNRSTTVVPAVIATRVAAAHHPSNIGNSLIFCPCRLNVQLLKVSKWRERFAPEPNGAFE
jgi:hypothetical protein